MDYVDSMNHQEAVAILRTLPKHEGWSASQAILLIRHLDRESFTRRTDYAEAITAAIIGQRWESVHGRPGYDTASTLARWLQQKATKYDNPEILFDAKTQGIGVGYSEKASERANKATQYLERRERALGRGLASLSGLLSSLERCRRSSTVKVVFCPLSCYHHKSGGIGTDLTA